MLPYVVILLYCLHLQRHNNIEIHVYKYLFDKTTIQTCLYLLSICWFCLWIHVPNYIVNIFKINIHSLLILLRRTNNIEVLFNKRKWSFVIGTIYPTSNNNYVMIDINSSVNKLNQRQMVTYAVQNIKFSCFPPFNNLITMILFALFPNTIRHNFIGKLDPIQITQWWNFKDDSNREAISLYVTYSLKS